MAGPLMPPGAKEGRNERGRQTEAETDKDR